MGSPSEPAVPAYRTFRLPWKHWQVLGLNLNRPELDSGNLRAGRPSDRLHERHPNQGCGEGTQKMRSIARVKGRKSPRAAGSTTSGPTEIFWGKPMPGTANGR